MALKKIKSLELLEEENKCLKLEHLELTVKRQMRKMWEMIFLKLEITAEGQVDRQAKISDPEEEVRILKSGRSTGQNNHPDVFKSLVPLEEVNKSLKWELLELTVKYQMRKMWEMINLELKDNALPSKQRKRRTFECDSDTRDDKLISTVIRQQEVPTDTNPFENERIVRHIMGYVNPEDLPKCREVCKLWRTSAQDEFEGKVTFHVKICRNDTSRLPMFMDIAAKSFPMFRNLKIELGGDEAQPNDKKDVNALFVKHGKQLHKLQLDIGGTGICGESWSLDDIRDIFLNSLEDIRELHISMSCHLIHRRQMFLSHHVKKTLVNLTTMNIGLNSRDCPSFHHHTTQVFVDLLRLIPNLRVLYWKSWGSKGIQATPNFIQSLININPLKLEKLFILSNIQNCTLDSIASSQLNLNQLDLHNVHTFDLNLVSSGRCKIVPRKKIFLAGKMDPVLEVLDKALALAQRENVSCTKLLHVFLITLKPFRC